MDLGIQIYELKIELLEIEPQIWRRVLVQLKHVIQIAMCWTDSHLHEFIVGAHSYSDPDFEIEEAKSEYRYRLEAVLPKTAVDLGVTRLFSKQFGIRNTNGTKNLSIGLEVVSIQSFSIFRQ